MKKKNIDLSQLILNIGFVIACTAFIVPFVIIVSASISNEQDILNYGFKILPMKVDWSAYRYVFKNPGTILQAYKVTAIFTVARTFFATLLMSMLAFGLTKKHIPGRDKISFTVFFASMFSGGLVPTYLLVTQYLHLADTIWVYIVTGLVSPWTVFMLRTFFQGIPYEITESCYMDGASEYCIFFKIILPLSTPVLATVAFTGFLGTWQDWMTSMYYINNPKLYSLQYLLQVLLKNIELLKMDVADAQQLQELVDIPAETVKMAMTIIVAGPVLMIFPFFQKYFTKGMVVGSVKG